MNLQRSIEVVGLQLSFRVEWVLGCKACVVLKLKMTLRVIRQIIVTAAHCVIGSGGENGYCDWVFVPEYYEDDASSAGTWAAQQFHWWTAYSNDGNEGGFAYTSHVSM